MSSKLFMHQTSSEGPLRIFLLSSNNIGACLSADSLHLLLFRFSCSLFTFLAEQGLTLFSQIISKSANQATE